LPSAVAETGDIMETRTVLMLTLTGYLQSSVAVLTKFAGEAAAEPA